MSQAQKCKRLHAEGMSIRRIASTLEIARNTVRRYVRGEQVPGQYDLRAGRPQPALLSSSVAPTTTGCGRAL